MTQPLHDDLTDTDFSAVFAEFIGDEGFPCIGAKAALETESIRFVTGGQLNSPLHDARIVMEIAEFARTITADDEFMSLVVLFPQSELFTELEFEAALWSRLQALHQLDKQDYNWDEKVSSDAASAEFSFSIGGRAFYVVGLHPGASRRARRFDCAALVFNAHSQFEHLRESGRFDKIREVILERDAEYSGSVNPTLAVHGVTSEARQYSGRAVPDNWACPFVADPAHIPTENVE